MRRSVVLWEAYVMRFEEVLSRYRRRRLTASEAGEVLGVSERQFRRLCTRYEDEGAAGLIDRRVGRVSGRRVSAVEVSAMCRLYREQYHGFNVKHFHEHLQRDHGYRLSYTFTRLALQRDGAVATGRRRGPHRQRRPRRPMIGMLLHQDGSRHEWLPGSLVDLIVTMDDATGTIYSAFLVEEEGTMSSFRGLLEVIGRLGLFCALYTDRGSHYFHTPAAGGPVDRHQLTQVGRALSQLGIQHIAAYSPEARGRSERMFGTLQGRLPNELRLAGITELAAANRFIAQTYLPDHNRRFSEEPAEPGSAFMPDPGISRDTLCVQEERVVGNDNTVRYGNLVLQLPPSPLRRHFAKVKVRVHHYPDGSLALFHGPRCLARYCQRGTPREMTQAA